MSYPDTIVMMRLLASVIIVTEKPLDRYLGQMLTNLTHLLPFIYTIAAFSSP